MKLVRSEVELGGATLDMTHKQPWVIS